MSEDLAAAMRRATDLTRTGNLDAATQAILQALGQKAPTAASPGSPARPPQGRVGRGLGEVVAGLRKARAPGAGAGAGAEAGGPTPPGASWAWRRHADRHGARDYRLYLPASAPLGLILMLHGCTQGPDDFALGTGMNAVADRHRLAVAWPAQTAADNPSGCWNWFRPGDQGRDGGEPAILAGLTRALMAEFGLNRNAVFAAGLSAGGAMAALLGETHADLFAAVGIHSGLPAGAASDLPSAMAAMRGAAPVGRSQAAQAAGVRTIVFHGTSDTVVHPSNAQRIADRARGAATGAAKILRGVDGGRAWQRTIHSGEDGRHMVEVWQLDGAGHAWSGGNAKGSFADATGPDASARMVQFFLQGTDDPAA
jgi:poly(hydroxyalkanoate) depolymerase family esterase